MSSSCLPIPQTVMTSDPEAEEAREFGAFATGTLPQAIHRAAGRMVGSRLGEAKTKAIDGAIRLAPEIFQRHVAAVADLRVTMIGDEPSRPQWSCAISSTKWTCGWISTRSTSPATCRTMSQTAAFRGEPLSRWKKAESTGLEPATSAVTGQRSNQLSYDSNLRNAKLEPIALAFNRNFAGTCA